MANLKTNYLGLELKNPIIVGASDLVSKKENLKAAEDAGAAAIVYKSLFEEQIQLEKYELDNEMNGYDDRHAEMIDLFPNIEHAGPREFLFNLKEARKQVNIPLIASLNALYKETWKDYARQLEDTGIDALELNFYSIPGDFEKTEEEIVKGQIDIIQLVKDTVKIPVSVKLSPFYTNTVRVISEMDENGADGFVLFNRMFQPDVDLKKEEHSTPFNLSTENDFRLPLRFAGLLYDKIKGSICSSNGIYNGEEIIKMILAGADAVQVVSTLYKNKISHISTMLKDIEKWMDEKDYESLEDFRGKLSAKNVKDPFVYKRAQYIELLLKSGQLLKSHTIV